MATPFLAEIKIFAGNFAPRNFGFCNGQLISIAQNTALFSLLGTTFGGNGQTTFGLPDLRGRAAVGTGQGAGLSNYLLGQVSGTPTATLTTNELPAHTHTAACFSTAPNPAPLLSPQGNVWAVAGTRRVAASLYKSGAVTPANMNAQATGIAGSSGPHNNTQPYLGISFIIGMQGIFPARN